MTKSSKFFSGGAPAGGDDPLGRLRSRMRSLRRGARPAAARAAAGAAGEASAPEACLVCLEPSPGDDWGAPSGCSHRFCLACIVAWAGITNNCPACRAPFDSIGRNGMPPLPVESKAQVYEMPEDDAAAWLDEEEEEEEEPWDGPCEVCGGRGDEAALLICDGCDGGFHVHCIGLSGVPAGDFYCPYCQAGQGPLGPLGPWIAARGGTSNSGGRAQQAGARAEVGAESEDEDEEAEEVDDGVIFNGEVDDEVEDGGAEGEAAAPRRRIRRAREAPPPSRSLNPSGGRGGVAGAVAEAMRKRARERERARRERREARSGRLRRKPGGGSGSDSGEGSGPELDDSFDDNVSWRAS